jgi:outer membrane protein OmpA-like peptidoglycan-associated protein
MNALRWLFKPRPYPAFVLLAIILTIFGVMMTGRVTIVGAALIVAALVSDDPEGRQKNRRVEITVRRAS